MVCRAVTADDAAEEEEDEEDDEEQHCAFAPRRCLDGQITIRQWAAYYLGIRGPVPDEQRFFEVHYV